MAEQSQTQQQQATDAIPTAITLSNGVLMPTFGLGLSHNGGFRREAVDYALQTAGIRLLDTAARYGNEAEVGQALVAAAGAGVARENVFVSTKLWPGEYARAHDAYAGSKHRLGTHADLYLVHWPGPWGRGGGRTTRGDVLWTNNREMRAYVWRQMELLYDAGETRAIGVSNFLQTHLGDIVGDNDGSSGDETAGIVPMVNQIEFNPFQYPKGLHEFCTERGIVVEGYCPLAKGHGLRDPRVCQMAQKYNLSPAALLCRWSLQHGAITIPKTLNPVHMMDNLTCFGDGMGIIKEDMMMMDGWHCDMRVTWDPTGVM